MIVDTDVAIVAAAEHHRSVRQRIARPHSRAGRVDVDDAGVTACGGDQAVRASHPGFRRFLHDVPPVKGDLAPRLSAWGARAIVSRTPVRSIRRKEVSALFVEL